jgi:hypothetical protein
MVLQLHPRGIPYLVVPAGAAVRYWSLVHLAKGGDESTPLKRQDNVGITLFFMVMVLLVVLYLYVRNVEL